MTNRSMANRTRRSIALVSEKGGTGKTTTLINLAQAVRMLGSSCLIIDCDPQASVSSWFQLVENSTDSSMKKYTNLLPHQETARTADELRAIHEQLDNLDAENDGYDWVFYDLAGYMGENIEYGSQAEIMLEVMRYADCLLTPIIPDAFTVMQATKATPKFKLALEKLGRTDEVKCFTVLNRIRISESISKQTITDVTNMSNDGVVWPLLENYIEHSSSIPNHLANGRNCYIPHVHTKTAKCYEDVLRELISKVAPEKVRSVISLSSRKRLADKQLKQEAKQEA